MVFILLLNSNSFCLFPNNLEAVPSAPTTIGITVNLMFLNFFSSGKIQVFAYLFISFFAFYGPPEEQNLRDEKFFFSCSFNTKFGLPVVIG